MKIAIIEDEKYARIQLQNMLGELTPKAEIAVQLDSVADSVAWLSKNECDLIFMDIQLADALSFKIFDQIDVKAPIIFTTAYDQYALKAFQVNSVDYLLKPIEPDSLKSALDKYEQFHRPFGNNTIEELRKAFAQVDNKSYQKRFLVKLGDKISSVTEDNVAYFEGEDRYVTLMTPGGERYFVNNKLADLEPVLDPDHFFRLNRSFICRFEAIDTIIPLSKSRVMVKLKPAAKRDVVVSTEKTREFKLWLNR
ncbi:MAG: LytTR family DNA-binding domain-containing protein [Bacteroidota bacterium]